MNKKAPLSIGLGTSGVRRPNQPAPTAQVLDLSDDSPAAQPVPAPSSGGGEGKKVKTTHLNISSEVHKALRIYAASNETTIKDVADEVLTQFLQQHGYLK